MNGQDKEALVIDLLNKGHTAREIAKLAHVSFTDITRIKRKVTGECVEDDIEKAKSMASQSFRMFLENKSLVDVAISRNIPTEQVIAYTKTI
ncbi:MAG: Trp family transcriptional regulator [Thermoproteota archaeon]|nr:Trp family transcriptional regulator [Thermoproteota archaeon]